MPTKYVQNELFHSHMGVDVFHTYRNDDMDQGSRDYWYTTDADGSENGRAAFDVRDLTRQLNEFAVAGKRYDADVKDSHEQIIEAAIEKKLVVARLDDA